MTHSHDETQEEVLVLVKLTEPPVSMRLYLFPTTYSKARNYRAQLKQTLTKNKQKKQSEESEETAEEKEQH